MKKIGLAILGITAAIIALANLGSLLALALSVLIAYAGFHYYRKSDSTITKLFWGGVLLIGLLTAIANVPAFFGIISIIAVLYVWRKWNGVNNIENENVITPSNDPFSNFERQWNDITK